jgi:hypothetical protein
VAAAERPVDRLLDRRRHRPKGHRTAHKRKHHKDPKTKAFGPAPVPPVPVPPVPAPICQELQKACTTNAGTECCPSVDPNVVCAGGLNPSKTCQDCTAAPTAAGAYCQDSPGNQCCGGKPGSFVGVRVEDNQPACYSTGTCRSSNQDPGKQCSTDADCGGSKQCVKGASNCGCSAGPGEEPTFCGTPATA